MFNTQERTKIQSDPITGSGFVTRKVRPYIIIFPNSLRCSIKLLLNQHHHHQFEICHKFPPLIILSSYSYTPDMNSFVLKTRNLETKLWQLKIQIKTLAFFTWFCKFLTDVEHAIYMALQQQQQQFQMFLEFGSQDFLAFAQKVTSL